MVSRLKDTFTAFLLARSADPLSFLTLWNDARRKRGSGVAVLPPKTVHLRLQGRLVSIRFRPGTEDLFVIREIFAQECYALPQGLKPKVILDLGGNIGLAALFFALLAPDAVIHSFEPLPANFELLKANAALNPFARISPHPFGISDKTETVMLQSLSEEHFGAFSAVRRGSAGASSHQVNMRRLDEILDELNLDRIDVLKIDVEGAEFAIFPMLASRLSSIEVLMGELHGDTGDPLVILQQLSLTHRVDYAKTFFCPFLNFRASKLSWLGGYQNHL